MAAEELARHILERIVKAEEKTRSLGYAAPSVLGECIDDIKELCERQFPNTLGGYDRQGNYIETGDSPDE